MNYKNSIIIGADAGNLRFLSPEFTAYVRLPDGREVYAVDSPNPDSDKLAFDDPRFVETHMVDVPVESVVLARRYPVDFSKMDDNEIDCRWHAIVCSKKNKQIFRIVSVDKTKKEALWYIEEPRGKPPTIKATPWNHTESAILAANNAYRINELCAEYLVSIIAPLAAQKHGVWKAQSSVFSMVEAENENRYRAVLELLILAHYQRDQRLFISFDAEKQALDTIGKLQFKAK